MTPIAPTRHDRLRIAFAIAAAGTLLITVTAVAGWSTLLVFDRAVRESPFLLAWIVAAGGFGHWPTLALAPKDSPKMLLRITGVGLGFGVISLLTLALGTLGWLNTATAYSLLGVGVIAFPWYELLREWRAHANVVPFPVRGERAGERASALKPADHSNLPVRSPSPQPISAALTAGSPRVQGEGAKRLRLPTVTPIWFAWLPMIALGGIMLVADCVPPGLIWKDEPHSYDVMEYHLQVPREWYEAGQITPLDHNVFSFLPMNVEMHYLLAMQLHRGPWAGMYLAQLMNAVFIVAMIVALYAAIGWPAALAASATPWLTMLGSICYVEAGQLMWATLAIIWLLRDKTFSTAIIAGIAAGFACGAKLTAAPMLVVILPIAFWLAHWIPIPLYSRERLRVRARAKRAEPALENSTSLTPTLLPEHEREGVTTLLRGVAFSIVALLVFLPWLTRSFINTGNPIFPEAMTILGRGHFNELQQQRWEKSLQPAPAFRSIGGRCVALWQQVIAEWRWGFALIPLAVASFFARRDRLQRTLLLTIILQTLFWLCFTHLQGRFLLLALPPAAIAIGRADSRLWRGWVIAAATIASLLGVLQLATQVSSVSVAAGLTDFNLVMPEKEVAAIQSGRPVALIGNAKAFLFQMPMSRLSYRTVFDVRATPDQQAADHWLDPADVSSAERLIDDDELQRLGRTYHGLPKAP